MKEKDRSGKNVENKIIRETVRERRLKKKIDICERMKGKNKENVWGKEQIKYLRKNRRKKKENNEKEKVN